MWSDVLAFSWNPICPLSMRLCFLQTSFNLASDKKLNIFNIEMVIQIHLYFTGSFFLPSLCIPVIYSCQGHFSYLFCVSH